MKRGSDLDDRRCERFVLADWFRAASYLRVDATGVSAHDFSPA